MLPALVAMATALLLLLLPTAAGAATDWRSQLGATAANISQASSAEHKRRLDAPLRPHAKHALSTALLDAVAADAASGYTDDEALLRAFRAWTGA